MVQLSIIGDIFCDVLASIDGLPIFNWGEDRRSPQISILPGGAGLNTSCHAANYSRHVKGGLLNINFFSAVGNDCQGQLCLDTIEKDELINNCIVKSKTDRTATCIVLSGQSDRTFISDHSSCLSTMSMSWFDEEKILEGQHVHIAGYYNITALHPQLVDFLALAHSRGLTTSINPQYDARKEWSGIKDLANYLTLLICNEDEVLNIAGGSAGGNKDVSHVSTAASAAKEILSWGVGTVVVTLAAKGVQAYSMNAEDGKVMVMEEVKAVENLKVIDATGAGDAFAGAFLVEYLLNERCIPKALKSGVITGACAVQLVGASTVPSEEMLQSVKDALHALHPPDVAPSNDCCIQ